MNNHFFVIYKANSVSTSEITTLWRYTNLFIIIIIKLILGLLLLRFSYAALTTT